MMLRNWKKWLLGLVTVLGVATAVYPIAAVWVEFKLMYPSEQIFCKATSLDGEKVAALSVKYEGERAWLPLNPKPHHYITVTDAHSGRILLREVTVENGAANESFARLRERYAPWTNSVTVDCRLPGAWNDFGPSAGEAQF